MEGLTLGAIFASVIAGIVVLWIVWLHDLLLHKTRNQASIQLATSIFEHLDTVALEKTTKSISMSKQLGDELVRYYKTDQPFDEGLKNELVSLLEGIISGLQPLVSKLMAAKAELDELRVAVSAFDEGIKWRLKIINHLCSPPNPSTMDAGHVREQLISVNCLPDDLLRAARGEALLFLRGNGLSWLKRRKYKRQIIKKMQGELKVKAAMEYRSVLQQTALANRK